MKKIIYTIFIGLTTVFTCNSCSDKNDSAAAPSPNGMGGSMARFTLAGDFLYTVDNKDLKVFDVSVPADPVFKKDIQIGRGIETIFPYKEKLFIGSQTGMYIYDLANPLEPNYLSMYEHLTACDPVVVKGDYAYVTLRSGSDCRFGQNLLDVLNISDPRQPILVSTTGMDNPHGLGISENSLFVCEGNFGFKVFNIEDPEEPVLISHQEGFHAYDVIVLPNVLIITGNDGLYQYNYQDLQELKLLSVITVSKES